MLNIVPIKVWGDDPAEAVLTYALLDTGSTTTICSRRLVTKLKLEEIDEEANLQGIGASACCNTKVNILCVQGLHEEHVFRIPSVRVLQELPDLASNIPSESIAKDYVHLNDIEFPRLPSSRVDLLLGMDAHEVFRIKEQRCGNVGEPLGWRTAIGWTIFGAEFAASVNADGGGVDTVLTAIKSPERLQQQVLQMFERDFNDAEEAQLPTMSRQDKQALEVMEGSIKKVEGHYEIKLPWKEEMVPIPNNKVVAEQRLGSLKRKLSSNKEVKELYSNKIKEYIDNGYASLVTDPAPLNRTWYLPHHCTGQKFRVVFDCAAKYKSVSLNSMLLQGPDLCNNLTGVLLRFRQEAVAFVADIRGMFHQVRVHPGDRDALRFLWWPDGDLQKSPAEYQMNVFPFGATCSPSCTTFALLQTAKDNATNASEEVTGMVGKCFYVDDLLKSCSNVQEAVGLIDGLVPLLESGGFHLTKFIANNPDVLRCVPEQDRAPPGPDVHLHDSSLEKALGVFWNTSTDCLKVQVDVQDKPMTRRGLLSMINQVYDVLGIVQPFILPIRKLLQESCVDGDGWDDPIPEASSRLWHLWMQSLPQLREVSVPRGFKRSNLTATCIELHVFCDASTTGYGVASYIRVVYADETVTCVFCMGKSRVVPAKPVTVPRLELTAAAMAVKLCAFICGELDFNFSRVILWTDATVVLQYINNVATRFKVFVANRLQTIHSLTMPEQWRHVPTEQNPADIASRGLMPDKATTDRAMMWFQGPQFLLFDESRWPQQPDCILQPLTEDPEVKGVKTCAVVISQTSYLYELLARCSHYAKACRYTAWWIRFKDYLRWKNNPAFSAPKVGRFSVPELKNASLAIVQLVQWEAFPQAMCTLPNVSEPGSPERFVPDEQLTNSACFHELRKLSPFVLNGIMRMDGRLQSSALPFQIKHPIILPAKHAVTEMIIREHHEREGHSGTSHVLNSVRKQFWIIRGRAAVRKVLLSCQKCRYWNAGVGKQRMAELPKARVTAGQPPFTATGVDLMGPLIVRQGRSNVKRYVVVFTCMATRAVHLEVAQSLESSAFIQAFRRFCARRQKPKYVFSDNGTNFKGADRELNEGIKVWNSQQFQNGMLQEEILWSFNVPTCSHAGGVWERIIRSIRKLMRVIVGEATLDDFDLSTLMAEIESILNNRPITDVSTDPRDLSALTPSMLLTGSVDDSTPPDVFMKKDRYVRSWRKTQLLADQFWSRWLNEYLPLLQPRQKWWGTSPNLEVGDLVLLKDDTVKRGQWPKAIVEQCFPDKNGLVRRVQVRTANAVLVRDVRKICLLEGHFVEL